MLEHMLELYHDCAKNQSQVSGTLGVLEAPRPPSAWPGASSTASLPTGTPLTMADPSIIIIARSDWMDYANRYRHGRRSAYQPPVVPSRLRTDALTAYTHYHSGPNCYPGPIKVSSPLSTAIRALDQPRAERHSTAPQHATPHPHCAFDTILTSFKTSPAHGCFPRLTTFRRHYFSGTPQVGGYPTAGPRSPTSSAAPSARLSRVWTPGATSVWATRSANKKIYDCLYRIRLSGVTDA